MLRFANVEYFYVLWFLPILIAFFVFVFRAKQRALMRFGNLQLMQKLIENTSRKKQIYKIAILLFALLFIVLSLARPQIGTKLEEISREGVDIIVAMDVSTSMLAQDIAPSRLAKAKHEVESLIDRLRGDRIGLIAFSGVAFVQCPLTLDYGAAKIFLDIMDPDLIPTPGTAIGRAIQKAIDTFEQKERKHKVLVLITDGETHEESVMQYAEEAERQGIVIYCVGIGSPQGEPIPLQQGGGSNFKKDKEGQVVITKLDERSLEKIALQTGGKYFRSTSGEEELEKIYDLIFKMDKKELGSLQYSQFEDRFQYLVIFSIVLLGLDLFVSDRKKVKREWRGRFL
jgi:Ca-activated chloride channel homolog